MPPRVQERLQPPRHPRDPDTAHEQRQHAGCRQGPSTETSPTKFQTTQNFPVWWRTSVPKRHSAHRPSGHQILGGNPTHQHTFTPHTVLKDSRPPWLKELDTTVCVRNCYYFFNQADRLRLIFTCSWIPFSASTVLTLESANNVCLNRQQV